MLKKNLSKSILILIPFMLISCAGMEQPGDAVDEIFGDQTYEFLTSITIENETAFLYVQEDKDPLRLYSEIDASTSLRNWTFLYEYHPIVITNFNEEYNFVVSALEEYVISYLDSLQERFEYDISLYSHGETYQIEHAIDNEREQEVELILIEDYYRFNIRYQNEYYYIILPMNLHFQKIYDQEIQDLYSDDYLSFSTFITQYDVYKKER